jgi:hypothetical protein
VFLIDAEYDCLREAVRFLQEIGKMSRDGVRAGSQRHHSFEIFGLVLIVRNRSSEAIQLVSAGTPSGCVPCRDYPVNPVWREEAVIYALPKAVLINRIAEVEIRVAVIFAKRSRCHAKLEGGLEMLQDRAPRAITASAAPMAFINDDKVKEVCRVITEEPFASFVFSERLINSEIHFAAVNYLTRFNLVAGISERSECFILWIVDQDSPVGKEENARLAVFTGPVPAARPATTVFPVPVAIIRSTRFLSANMASMVLLIAIC